MTATTGEEAAARRRQRALRLLAVVGGPLAASGLAELTWDGEGRLVPAIWFLAVVVAATLLVDRAVALWCIAVSCALLVFVFVDPRFSTRAWDVSEMRGVVAFALAALALVLLLDHLQRSRNRAEAATAERDRSLGLVDSLLANAPVGIAFFNRELRFVRINEALADINGRPIDEHLGRTVDEVLGEGAAEAQAILQRVLQTGQPVIEVPISGRRRDGVLLHVIASYYPVRDLLGRVEGVGVVVRDVTSQILSEAERQLLFDRVARIQEVTSGLAGAATVDEVVAVVIDHGRRALDADTASVGLLDPDGSTVRLRGVTGFPEDMTRRWLAFPLDTAAPHSEVIRTGKPVLLSSAEEVDGRYPELGAELVALGRKSLVSLPLVAEGRVIGAVGFSFADERSFDPGTRTFLAAIAGQCAAALDRARLYEAELEARAEAEAAGRRLALLGRASNVLASTLDWESAVAQVAQLVVPQVAGQCLVLVDEGSSMRPLAVADSDPARAERTSGALARHPAVFTALVDLEGARREGTARWLVDTARLVDAAVDETQRHDLAQVLGGRAGVTVAIRTEGVTGAVVISNPSGALVDDDDCTLTEELGRRVGQAVVNARLFAERAHIATTLQESLLPRSTATIPGIEVATRFLAGGQGVDVGGDFYDIFAIGPPDAPVDSWAVVIGDVRGKGVEAATLTATARNTIRSIAVLEESPARMLGHLNTVLLRASNGGEEDDEEPRFCTAAVATLSLDEDSPGRVAVRIAVAGHPLPFALWADGRTSQAGTPGTLLGVLADLDTDDVDIELGPGDALVLYTDGLTERHADDRFFDEQALAAVLSRCAGFSAATLADRIETAARAFVEDDVRDDLALVVVRVPERAATSTSASIELPPEPVSPRQARRFVTAALAALGMDGVVETAELLTSEVVTNAVIHGGSDVRIAVETPGAVIRISVYDADPTQPEVRHPDGDSEHGRGMLLVETLSARWGVDLTGQGKCVWFELML